MKSIPALLIRLGIFAVAMALVLVAVLQTIERPASAATDDYSALFTDASGLHAGDDVRQYGVAVGKVADVALDGDLARVEFTVEQSRPLSRAARLVIRYQNLTGQRYIDIQDPGDDPGAATWAPGDTVGIEHTVGSFDVTTLFNGLQPVLDELSPAEVNKFTGSMLAVIEGDGSGIGPALDAVERLADYATDRQSVISLLVRNLSAVSEQIGGKSGNAVALISELTKLFTAIQEKLPNLIQFAEMIPPLLDPLDDMLDRLGLIGDPNPSLDALIDGAFGDDPERAVADLGRLPGLLQSLAALIPANGNVSCSKGTAETEPTVEVLVRAQRILVCNAG